MHVCNDTQVFSQQAAPEEFGIFSFVERFFIIKGYLSVDVAVGDQIFAVTNIHLNTGAGAFQACYGRDIFTCENVSWELLVE